MPVAIAPRNFKERSTNKFLSFKIEKYPDQLYSIIASLEESLSSSSRTLWAAIKRVMEIYQKSGTKYSYVDCDGDFRLLIPAWLESGVNIMFPLEVASGIHPLELRQKNKGIRMMGGVDKVVLTGTKDDIKKELLKLKPLVDEGGYIPHVDHRVQADVPYENYLYYLLVKREIFEIPNKIAS